ncbi:MAG: hypothetical protein JNL97_15250 [Verrucomicrobiales bacterium]|nr:hypothetical protein [Verrucomicrobiales bacterium]
MQNFQKIAITVAFSFTCFSVPVLGAAKSGSGQAREKAAVEALGGSGAKPGSVSVSAVGAVGDVAVIPGGNLTTGGGAAGAAGGPGAIDKAIDTPAKPDWVGSMAVQVEALKAQFRKERADLLSAYEAMRKQAKEVGKEERDRVREQFKVKREEMYVRQKELREELMRRFQEFRADHPNHLDVIDAAKERTKEGVRERRGHGGE